MLPAFAVVDRIYTAVLRSVRGERLGRFSVTPRDGLELHTWEWHGAEWPGEAVYMVPDAQERPADMQIGETYSARPDVQLVAEPLTALRRFEAVERLYEVDRIDGHCHPLGLLAVTERGLTWLESGAGGFHALAPAHIRFTPRARLDCVSALDRLLVQHTLQASGPLRVVGRAFG
ncbi:MAG: hypothetical protein H6703_02650 [Myxococcales bacterium]|nr:hypothetical protein [Myxococcales bacterium]